MESEADEFSALSATAASPPAGPKPIGPPAAGVLEREIDGCLALLSPSEERVLLLNETASDVWRLVDGQLTLDGIVDLLARAYDVDADLIYQDIERTVTLFAENDLLVISDD